MRSCIIISNKVSLGIYKAEQLSPAHNQWIENKDLKIQITVDVNF